MVLIIITLIIIIIDNLIWLGFKGVQLLCHLAKLISDLHLFIFLSVVYKIFLISWKKICILTNDLVIWLMLISLEFFGLYFLESSGFNYLMQTHGSLLVGLGTICLSRIKSWLAMLRQAPYFCIISPKGNVFKFSNVIFYNCHLLLFAFSSLHLSRIFYYGLFTFPGFCFIFVLVLSL